MQWHVRKSATLWRGRRGEINHGNGSAAPACDNLLDGNAQIHNITAVDPNPIPLTRKGVPMRHVTRNSMIAVLMVVGAFAASAAERPGTWWQPADSGRTAAELDAILGPGATTRWEIPPVSRALNYRVVQDDQLGRPALVCEGPRGLVLKGRTTFQSEVEMTCLVRPGMTAKGRATSFSLDFGKDPDNPRAPGLRVSLQAWAGRSDYVALASVPFRRVVTRVNLRPYGVVSPVWEDTVRVPLEQAMAAAPLPEDAAVEIRCRIGRDRVRVWIDDRLLLDATEAEIRALRDAADKDALARITAMPDGKAKTAQLQALKAKDRRAPALPTSGAVEIILQPGVRLASFSVAPVAPEQELYESIRLDGYANARQLLGAERTAVAADALPFGQEVMVQGIPFRFVARGAGADHIDVGQSLFRQANMEGYHPSNRHRFAGTTERDPGRIQLRIPNGRYDALYVIAAFDDAPNSIPTLSASFYRPQAGFARIFETTVPSWRAQKADATALPVKLENGKTANLWLVKIPLSPEALASFSDMDTIEGELTKKVHQYRSYPDPFIYGWHQGGLPSGVQVYAATLHRPELHFSIEPTVFGHVWAANQLPSYDVTLENRTPKARTVTLAAETTSYDGTEKTKQSQKVTVPGGRTVRVRLNFSVRRFGIHTLRVTMHDGATAWGETRNFARLAPDTRAVKYEPGKGPMFGYWSYHGGHYTPPAYEVVRLMTMAGARGSIGNMTRSKDPRVAALAEKYNLQGGANAWPVTPQWSWAGAEKVDPKAFNAYKEKAIAAIRRAQGDNPDMVTFFPEPHISRDLTAGNLPSYWGDPVYKYNEQEANAIRVFFNTSKAAAEAVRTTWPKAKIIIPWGDPLFIVPLLRAGFPKSLIDGSGLDMVGFERLPEQQLYQQSTHRLYLLKEEYRKFGEPNPFLPYVEGVFVPTEPGACTWRGQADRYHRWALISLAYGITHFYSGWFAFDCGNYYGAEHYGGCGIQRRIPYCDPKPAYATYATMTRMLDRAKFDRWLPTGSLSTFCLRFTREKGGPVYALWTVRGKRPVGLTLAADGAATVHDSMDNATTVKTQNKVATIEIGESPVYVTDAGDIVSIALGKPDHSGAIAWARNRNEETWLSGPVVKPVPVAKTITLGSLGDGSWTIKHEHDTLYETNNYDAKRFLGRMSAKVVTDAERPGNALAVHLEKQDTVRKTMPWYSVLVPRKPVVIPGKSKALGLWVKAHSDWGRVVYCLRDAKGERWTSTGARDQWNCNDVHSWSSFNFDGWRYLRFETPSHTGYDNFREFGTTWWGHVSGADVDAGGADVDAGGDGIVDLPLSIEKIIVERRTHVIYVNDIQPADPSDVLLGELIAEYGTAFDATDGAVAQSRVRMPLPKTHALPPNPIAALAQNPLPPVQLKGVRDPDWGYDGTRCHVDFTEAPGAVQYQVWVGVYPDGSGAVQMGRMTRSGQLLQGLRPETTFYLWVTYTDKDRKQSKPSNRLTIKLVDAFGQK